MDKRELLGGGENTDFNAAYQPFDGDFDLDQQLEYQDYQIEEQDRHLEAISTTAKQLTHIGYHISDELDDQNEMMEDLHDGMGQTGNRLRRENEHIAYVSEKAKAGGLCCTIFLLIVAIVVVAAIPF